MRKGIRFAAFALLAVIVSLAIAGSLFAVEEKHHNVNTAGDVSTSSAYSVVTDYECPKSLKSVVTGTSYAWILQEDGSLSSGNAGVSSSISVLKVSVIGSGALSFQYKVSSSFLRTDTKLDGYEFQPDSLVVWKAGDGTGETELSALQSSYDNLSQYGMSRYYVDIDWKLSAIKVEAASEDQVTLWIHGTSLAFRRSSQASWYSPTLKRSARMPMPMASSM